MLINHKEYEITDKYEITDMSDDFLLIPNNSNVEKSKVLILSDISALIWRYLFVEKKSLENTVALLMDRYDISEYKIKNDINVFINKLLSYQVILHR